MSNDKRAPIDELHRRIGRNLLRFQAIEQSLRLMLPYIHPNGGAKGADAMRQYREGNDSKPLGLLIEQLKGSMSGTPELWEGSLANLLSARNELVHQFYSRFDFVSPAAMSEALTYLDQQFEQAEEWWKILRTQSLLLLLILLESNASLAAEYGAYRERLVEQLPPSLEIIDATSPSRTIWKTTRIVKLLRLAELQTECVGGMTLLSRAGAFIKQQSPELGAKEYGLKTLKEILVASGLFEVAVADDGTTVMYRSNAEFADPLTDLHSDGLSFSIVRNS